MSSADVNFKASHSCMSHLRPRYSLLHWSTSFQVPFKAKDTGPLRQKCLQRLRVTYPGLKNIFRRMYGSYCTMERTSRR